MEEGQGNTIISVFIIGVAARFMLSPAAANFFLGLCVRNMYSARVILLHPRCLMGGVNGVSGCQIILFQARHKLSQKIFC